MNKKTIAFVTALCIFALMTGCANNPFQKKEEPTEPPPAFVGDEVELHTTEAPTIAPTEALTEAKAELPMHDVPFEHVRKLESNVEDDTEEKKMFASFKVYDGESFDITSDTVSQIAKANALKNTKKEQDFAFENLALQVTLTAYKKGEPPKEEEEETIAKKEKAKTETTEKPVEEKDNEEEETTEPPKDDELIYFGTDDDKIINIIYAQAEDNTDVTATFPGGIQLGMSKDEVNTSSLGKGTSLDISDNTLYYKNKSGFLYIEFDPVFGTASRILLMQKSAFDYTEQPVQWQEQDIDTSSFNSFKKNTDDEAELSFFLTEDADYDILNAYTQELMESVELGEQSKAKEMTIMGASLHVSVLSEPAPETEEGAEPEPVSSIRIAEDEEGKLIAVGINAETGKDIPITFCGDAAIGIGTPKNKVEEALGKGADGNGHVRPGTEVYYKNSDASVYIIYHDGAVKELWVIKNKAVPGYKDEADKKQKETEALDEEEKKDTSDDAESSGTEEATAKDASDEE